MRSLIFELRSDWLADDGLAHALERQAEVVRARYGLTVETFLPVEPDVALAVKEALYRIAQEATHNIGKHANATTVSIRLYSDVQATVLEISDDGAGFDSSSAFPGHAGLRSMRERAEMIGATLEIDSQPGKGSTVRIRVPCEPR